MSAALDHLAARVGTDPLFLANALAEYARSEGLDDAGLAVALGCAESDLAGLRLCGVPRPERFREDAMRIAARFRNLRHTQKPQCGRGPSGQGAPARRRRDAGP